MSRQLSLLALVLGVLLMVAAPVLALVVVPSLAVFPDDAASERILNLDYLTLFRPEEMAFFRSQSGDGVRMERQVRVEAVEGDAMLIREDQQILNDDEPLIELVYHYALDRRDLRQAASIPDAWRDYPGYWARDGFVIQWQLDTHPEDYDGWVEDYRETRQLDFIREETRAGIDTYYFESRSDPAPMQTEQVEFLGLPTRMNLEQLTALASQLQFSDPDVQELAASLFPLLISLAIEATQDIPEGEPLTAPLLYAHDYWGEYWVEPITGTVIDTVKYERRTVTFPPEIIEHMRDTMAGFNQDPAILDEVLPVVAGEFVYRASEVSIAQAKSEAQEGIDQLTLFGQTIPLGLAVLGMGLVGAGAFLRGRPV